MKQFKIILALIICFACRSVTGMVANRTAASTRLSVLMRAKDSYLNFLVDDLKGLVDQYVNPWKTTELGKCICGAKGKPFTRPDDTDPEKALRYQFLQGHTLKRAYGSCYQKIDHLKFDLKSAQLPSDDDSIYQLLNSNREELITEYLLQQKLFALDYSDESTDSEEKSLLFAAGVSKSSIQQFALGLASAMTRTELSSLDDPNTIHTILAKANASDYSSFNSTIAGLLLIAGAVKDTNAADKNIALTLALRNDSRLHEIDILETDTAGPLSVESNSALFFLPVIRHPRPSPQSNRRVLWPLHLCKEEDPTAPYFDRKWRYIFAYRLSREMSKPQAKLPSEIIHFLAASGAHFNIFSGWAELDGFVYMNGNINAVDTRGSTALHKAIQLYQEPVVEKLLIATPLHHAIRRNPVTIVEKLLAACANSSVTNNFGETPLHIAVEENSESIVDKLLAFSSPVNEVNNDGDTPLTIARRKGFRTIIEKLLTAGANNNTSLHKAINANRNVDRLLTADADVNAVSDDGDTPLHSAVREKHFKIAETFVAMGANPNIVDTSGNTALHLAVGNTCRCNDDLLNATQLKIIDRLLSAQANLNIQNRNGDTPLHIAARSRDIEIIHKLLNHSPDLTLKNNLGLTAWDLAQEIDDYSIMYHLAGTRNQCIQTVARYRFTKSFTAALLIGAIAGIAFKLEKKYTTAKVSNAITSIAKTFNTHTDDKATILYQMQFLLTSLSNKSPLTMEEDEISALRKLLDTKLMTTLKEELMVLHRYCHLLRDNHLHVEWANLYKAHQDFFRCLGSDLYTIDPAIKTHERRNFSFHEQAVPAAFGYTHIERRDILSPYSRRSSIG